MFFSSQKPIYSLPAVRLGWLLVILLALLVPPRGAQAQPGSLRMTGSTTTSVTIAWDGVGAGATYEYQQVLPRLRSSVNVGSVTTKTITGLGHSTYYGFQIRSILNGVTSDWTGGVADGHTKPLAPPNFRATCVAGTFVELKWNAPQQSQVSLSPTSFQYELKINSGAWQSRARSRTRKVDQLSLGTTYTFAVRTVLDRSGLAGYSDASTLTVTTAAAQVEPPTGLQTSAVSDTSVKLTWTASTTSSVSYEVSTDGSTWVDSGSDLEHIFSGLDPETRYSLRARAKSGSSTSCANAAPPVTTLPTAPSAPTSLQTSGISQTAITLGWSKSAGATAYKVRKDSSDSWTTLGDVATHTFSGLTANTQYTLEVIASNAGGESSAASVSARTLVNAPATPTDLASLGGTHNSITISWTKSAGATAYKVQVNSGDVTTLGDVATHTFSGLTADTSYTLKVVASNAGGDSSAVSVSARTKLVTPPVTLGTVTHNSIVINWTKSTGATAYKVRKDSSDDWTTLGDVATHTFSGLTPNTAYDIEVLASNSHGDSAAGTVTGTTTHDLDATATHNANLTATHNANLTATANANLTATANANLTATANANLTATANANLTATANANLTATQLVLSNGATQTQQAVNLTATANAPTATSTSTPTPTATSTSTPTPTATSTSTPTPTATATSTSTPTATATATANANLTATANANLTATHNANLTATHNANLTATHNANLTATHNANLTATHNANLTATHNANLTATHNANLTATANANLTATHNANLTATANANMTATQNANLTATHNANLTATHNANLTATQLVLSNSVTQTQQAINLTATASVPTATPTPTPTPTATATSTPTPTATATPTLTNTPLPGSPAAPTNLQTSGISQTAITLSWSKSTGATAYKVQANSGTVLTLGDVATHTFSGLTADTQYTLRVIASNAGGDSSAASISARTQSTSPTALADPSGVSTSGITQTSITLNWTKESAATSYEVQGGSHSSWHDVGDVATYTFSGLTANTQYILQVRSKNSQTTSTGISITRSTLVNPPAPPSNLNSDSISDGGFNIDWDQSSGASGYETRGDDMSDSPGSQAAGMLSEWTNIGNVNTYSYSGLEPDTLYRIYVRAGNSGGMSEPRHIDVRTLASPGGIGENTRSETGASPGSNDFPGFDVPPSDDDSSSRSSGRSGGSGGSGGSESSSEPTATATISSPAFNCTSQQKAMIDISSQPIGLNLQCVGPKGVGNADLIERGVVLGVDVWGWVRNFEVCFKQAGELVFLDAAYAPRLLTSARPYSRGGMICSQLDRAGTLVLLRGDTPQLPVATAETTESTSTQRQFDNCRVTLADFLNFRATPGGQVMLVLPAGVSLSVLDWQGDWVQVDYYGRKGWLHSDYLTAQGDCG